jgi:hypothetical protein
MYAYWFLGLRSFAGLYWTALVGWFPDSGFGNNDPPHQRTAYLLCLTYITMYLETNLISINNARARLSVSRYVLGQANMWRTTGN